MCLHSLPATLGLLAFWICGAFVYIHNMASGASKPKTLLQDYAQFAGFMLCRLGFSNHVYWDQLSSWKAEQFLSLRIVEEASQFLELTFSLSVLTLELALSAALLMVSHVCTQKRPAAETWSKLCCYPAAIHSTSPCLTRMWKQDSWTHTGPGGVHFPEQHNQS